MRLFCEEGNTERPNLARFFLAEKGWDVAFLYRWVNGLSTCPVCWDLGSNPATVWGNLKPPSVSSQRECLNCQDTGCLCVRCFQTPATFILAEWYSLGKGANGVCSPGTGWQEASSSTNWWYEPRSPCYRQSFERADERDFFFFFSPSMVCNSGDLNLRSFSSCLFLADLANSYSCWVWDIWTAPVMCPFRCRAKLGCLSVGYRV